MRTRDEKVYAKARKRLEAVRNSDILDWAYQAEIAMQQALDNYRRSEDDAALEEARQGALVMVAAIDVMKSRA